MFFDLMASISKGDMSILKDAVAWLLLSIPVAILALCVHEVAHGLVANKLGDPTAKNLGRLTLNPLKHLDLFGFISMVLFGYGWARPVPINTRNFKKPRLGMAACAVAGPLSNVAMAIIFAGLMKIFTLIAPNIPVNNNFTANVLDFTTLILSLGVILNLCYAVFNLIPVPPLDGSKIVYMFLPQKAYLKVMQIERYLSFVLLGLIIFGIIGTIFDLVVFPALCLLSFVFQIDFSILACSSPSYLALYNEIMLIMAELAEVL